MIMAYKMLGLENTALVRPPGWLYAIEKYICPW
jgi:hypothetical protein